MCQEYSARISQGGAISILKGEGRKSGSQITAKITLQNFEDEKYPTRAIFQFDKSGRFPSLNCCSLIIQYVSSAPNETMPSVTSIY